MQTPRKKTQIVIDTVAAAFRVEPAAIMSLSRMRPVVAARQVSMGILMAGYGQRATPRTLPEVGSIFDRDHTTVLHGVRRYKALCHRLGLAPNPLNVRSQAISISAHLGFVTAAQVADFLAPTSEPSAPEAGPPTEEVEGATEPAAQPAPVPTIDDLPAPEPETQMLAVIPTLPPQLSNGSDFGTFDVASWRGLPDAMRREGVLLFLTRDEIERPVSTERDRMTRAAVAFDLHAEALDELMSGRSKHDLDSGAIAPDGLLDARIVVEPRGTATDGFTDFARARLVLIGNGRADVGELFAAYCTHAKAADFDLMTRANFGSALRNLAKGAPRVGSVQCGVRMER